MDRAMETSIDQTIKNKTPIEITQNIKKDYNSIYTLLNIIFHTNHPSITWHYQRPDEKPPGGTLTRFGASFLSVGVTALGDADADAESGVDGSGLLGSGVDWGAAGSAWMVGAGSLA